MSDEDQARNERLLSPGDRFGNYRILEHLCEGGNECTTYRAVHMPSGATVALKIFHLESAYARQLFDNEVQAFHKIESFPSILPLYDYDDVGGVFYVATRFIEGGSLFALLRERGNILDIDEALQIFSSVADAVDYYHAASIIHRDLKPANILLSKTEQGYDAFVTDFGIARILDETRKYKTSHYWGTQAYSAPEVWDPDAEKTYAIDIYALGVMLYEALEGHVPFKESNVHILRELHQQTPPPYPTRIEERYGPEIVRAILKALSKNPKERQHSARELIEYLQKSYSTNEENQMLDRVRNRLGNYTVGQILGQSPVSITFRGQHNKTGEHVVVKVFPTGSLRGRAQEAFKDEVQALKNLPSHPAVLPLRDSAERTGTFYLVTDYLDGGNLRAVLDKHREGMEIKEVVRIFTRIAEAIDFIHKHGVIHRDIKPENIVLDENANGMQPFLTDFGLAKVLSGTQSFYTESITGTFRYMAPEAWDPKAKKNAAMDIYAFGVMLYEALEGRVPFSADYPAIITEHLSGEPPQPKRVLRDFGPQTADVLRSALVKNPELRPKTAFEIIEALKRSIPRYEMIGKHLGPYRVLKFLGGGAVGSTFKAVDERTNAVVALKLLPHTSDATELEIYQKIGSIPGVLPLLDQGDQDDSYRYLVTEYLDGGNLRRLVPQGAEIGDVREMLAIFRTIAEAVDALHRIGVVHRDLKPENVLLRRTEKGCQPCITDFGISRTVSGTQSFYTATISGTAYYTAPEAWTPGVRQTAAVDIYALGIMLYEALEGRLPFTAEYPAIGLQHLNDKVPHPQQVAALGGQQAVKALLGALEKKPENRPVLAVELVDRLSSAIAVHKTSGKTQIRVPIKKALQWPVRRSFFMVALFIVLIGTGVVFALNGRTPSNAASVPTETVTLTTAATAATTLTLTPSPQPSRTRTRTATLTKAPSATVSKTVVPTKNIYRGPTATLKGSSRDPANTSTSTRVPPTPTDAPPAPTDPPPPPPTATDPPPVPSRTPKHDPKPTNTPKK